MATSSGASNAGDSSALVLVVDDEPDLRTLYELTLIREGYRVTAAGNLAEAWEQLKGQKFDAVITDMRLPDGLGLEVLNHLSEQQRPERCIVMTAYGSAENAVESLKAGAFDYLTKPVDLKQFRAVVASAIKGTRGVRSGRPWIAQPTGKPALESDLTDADPEPPALRRMVGESEAMRNVKSRITRIARSMAPVLVHGESGTGKELVAQAIHGCSHRANGPFVAVNCGAIPENLLEAEFFGAKKGSYTGAVADREGFFQAARNGTLFLDEIGDLPLAMQTKLLRAIQERSIRSLGSTSEEAVDVRIVSATHKNLSDEVQAGRFRQDLFYRLNVIEIVIPPLRQRRSDLPALCKALLEKIAKESGLPAPTLSPHLLAQLERHPLQGNVRELENLLHRALALSDGSGLDLDLQHVEPPAPAAQTAASPKPFITTEPVPEPAPSAHLPGSHATSAHAPNSHTPHLTPPSSPAHHAAPHSADLLTNTAAPLASQEGAPGYLPTAPATQAIATPATPAAPISPISPVADANATPPSAGARTPQQLPLPLHNLPGGMVPDDLQAYLDAQEKAILTQVLQETQFNRTAAAARLKLSLRQMRYRIERLGIALPNNEQEGNAGSAGTGGNGVQAGNQADNPGSDASNGDDFGQP